MCYFLFTSFWVHVRRLCLLWRSTVTVFLVCESSNGHHSARSYYYVFFCGIYLARAFIWKQKNVFFSCSHFPSILYIFHWIYACLTYIDALFMGFSFTVHVIFFLFIYNSDILHKTWFIYKQFIFFRKLSRIKRKEKKHNEYVWRKESTITESVIYFLKKNGWKNFTHPYIFCSFSFHR